MRLSTQNLDIAKMCTSIFDLMKLFSWKAFTHSPVIFSNGIYNSSTTPEHLPWNTYNYCNAPHVNAKHYQHPENSSDPHLVYLNVIMRHHKRTPDNIYPNENTLNPQPWDCANYLQYNHGGGVAHVFQQTDVPAWHPFLQMFWNGTCDQGQLTHGGLEDSVQHGKDFFSLYKEKLGFLSEIVESEIFIRTSAQPRTMQVASGMLFGGDPHTAGKSFPVTTQPGALDSIPPSYPCPRANDIRDAYQSVPAWTDHIQANAGLQRRLDETLGTAGLSAWSSWYDHFFDTFTSRSCNGHPLPCNSTGGCVSEEDVKTVHEIGDFEYNYIWNTAENATLYNQLTFGVFMLELAQNFHLFMSGKETFKLRLYVGHDGTMIRLASLLGFGKVAPLRWPAFGSEIVIEVWETQRKEHFVRVLHEGTVKQGYEWIPFDDFTALLDSQTRRDVFQACFR